MAEASTKAASTSKASTSKASTSKASTSKASTSKAGTKKASAKKESSAGAAESAAVQEGRGLKLHHLRPAPGSRTARTRVGRGEASKGKTAGRGTKGTKARNKVAPGFEGGQMPLMRRLPKLGGFSNTGFKTTYQVVNTGQLTALYPAGGDVTPEDLVARGAVRSGELVKVLGTGDAGAGLRVTAHAFSASAREKITAAGGTVTEL
jgi:large subunit ribosomal protein L15